LVRRHQTQLFRIVRNLVPDLHMVEDLVQEIFMASFRHLGRFNIERASFRAWLFTIARNRCANHGKRERLRRHSPIEDVLDYRTLSNSAERNEFFHLLDEALAELPFDQRSAFVLIELEQLSYQEAAEIEQAQIGTIKSRLHRAKQKLRSALSPYIEASS